MAKQHQQLHAAPLSTTEGEFIAWYSEKGLAGLTFPGFEPRPKPADSRELPKDFKAWHRRTTRALDAALSGKQPSELPPLDLSAGTTFQQAVWMAMAAIPLGKTVSYGEIAKAIGKPGAVRAVGQACGANPIPLLVPCHRVLAANSRIGGFGLGLDWKRRLLALEGIQI